MDKNSSIVKASTFASKAGNECVFRRRNCPRGPSLFYWALHHVVGGECRDVVRMLHLQSWLDLGGTMSSIGSDLLKVFTAGEVTG